MSFASPVLANYLATKLSWRGEYRRVVVITGTAIRTHDPLDMKLTNEWPLHSIICINPVESSPYELLVLVSKRSTRLDSSSSKTEPLRFRCRARSHLISIFLEARNSFYTYNELTPRIKRLNGYKLNKSKPQYAAFSIQKSLKLGLCQNLILVLHPTGLCELSSNREHPLRYIPYRDIQSICFETSNKTCLVITTKSDQFVYLSNARVTLSQQIHATAFKLGININCLERSDCVRLLASNQAKRLRQQQFMKITAFKETNPSSIPVELIFTKSTIIEYDHYNKYTTQSYKYKNLLYIIAHNDINSKLTLNFLHEVQCTYILSTAHNSDSSTPYTADYNENRVENANNIHDRDIVITYLLTFASENENDNVILQQQPPSSSLVYYPHYSSKVYESRQAKSTSLKPMEEYFIKKLSRSSGLSSTRKFLSSKYLGYPSRLVSESFVAEVSSIELFNVNTPLHMGYRDSYYCEKTKVMTSHSSISSSSSSFTQEKEILLILNSLSQYLTYSVRVLLNYKVGNAKSTICTLLQAMYRFFHLGYCIQDVKWMEHFLNVLVDTMNNSCQVNQYWSLKTILKLVQHNDQSHLPYNTILSNQKIILGNKEVLRSILYLVPSSRRALQSKQNASLFISRSAVLLLQTCLQLGHRSYLRDVKLELVTKLLTRHEYVINVLEYIPTFSIVCAPYIAILKILIDELMWSKKQSTHSDIPATAPSPLVLPNDAHCKSIYYELSMFLRRYYLGIYTSTISKKSSKRQLRDTILSSGSEDKTPPTPPRSTASTTYYSTTQYHSKEAIDEPKAAEACYDNDISTFHNLVSPLASLAPNDVGTGYFFASDTDSKSTDDSSDKSSEESISSSSDPIEVKLEDYNQNSKRRSSAEQGEQKYLIVQQSVGYLSNIGTNKEVYARFQGTLNNEVDEAFAENVLEQSRNVWSHRHRRITNVDVSTRKANSKCDACVLCNDLCKSPECEFCAEKRTHLQLYFNKKINDSTNYRVYSSCEVRRHRSKISCWIIVKGFVYDVSDFLHIHPSGADGVIRKAGQDCTEDMKTHTIAAQSMLHRYKIGRYIVCDASGPQRSACTMM